VAEKNVGFVCDIQIILMLLIIIKACIFMLANMKMHPFTCLLFYYMH